MRTPLALRRTATSLPLAHPGLCRAPQESLIDRFRSALAAFALVGLFGLSLSPAQAANILIVAGTDSFAQTSAGVLNTDLSGTNTVTIVDTGVPVSLAGYTQIFDVRYDNLPALSVGEMNQYLAFLNAAPGNTVFLMGENSSGLFASRDAAIIAFVALAGGGTLGTVTSNIGTPETVFPPFTGPNVISTVTFADCGQVPSAGTGFFATSISGQGCAIAWDQGQLLNATTGALVVVFDVNFILSAPTFSPSANEIPFRLNLEHYVSSPPMGMPNFPAPSSAPTPTLTTWGMILLGGALLLFGMKAVGRRIA